MKMLANKELQMAALQEKQSMNSNTPVDFSEYRQIFTEAQIKELEAIGRAQRNDSSFVRKVVHFLYCDLEIEVIPSMKRCSKYMANREIMPKEIRDLIRSMLSIRLSAITSESFLYLHRLNRCNRHISRAIYNLACSKSEIVD